MRMRSCLDWNPLLSIPTRDTNDEWNEKRVNETSLT